ncbi:MAG: adenine phosphoribosyltransferase [Candidatus Bipolaricaulia bacterium]
MTGQNARDYLQLVDRSTLGRRYDVTPVFGDFDAFSALLDDSIELCREIEFDTVAAIDALGFILGAGIAVRSEKPLVPVRKGGKLPVEVHEAQFVDYTGDQKSLEIRVDALDPSNRVLLVDEWVETGAQVKAAVSLIERQGATVAGVLAINIDDSEAVRQLREKYPILAISQDL